MEISTITWFTEELKQRVARVFEPRYGRKLTDGEILTIANNLVQSMEIFTKLRWSKNYGEQIKTV